jgi:hypothetical protein
VLQQNILLAAALVLSAAQGVVESNLDRKGLALK